jgi:hypothetical protein
VQTENVFFSPFETTRTAAINYANGFAKYGHTYGYDNLKYLMNKLFVSEINPELKNKE